MKTIVINGADVNKDTIKKVSKALKEIEKESKEKQVVNDKESKKRGIKMTEDNRSRKSKIEDLILEIQALKSSVFAQYQTKEKLQKESEKDLEYMASIVIQFLSDKERKELKNLL